MKLNGYVIAPESKIDGFQYQLVGSFDELQPLPDSYVEMAKRFSHEEPRSNPIPSPDWTPERLASFKRYVSKVDVPNEGEGSRSKVFGIALRLMDKFPEASIEEIAEKLYSRAMELKCRQKNGRPFDQWWIEERVESAERYLNR